MGDLLHRVSRIPKSIVIGGVRAYQKWVSPWLGPRCRFQPTCSEYMLQAVEKHGLWSGTLRGLRRILRCHPFHPGGWDPP
jgi:putative membrane protein insertion efficiency factor